MAWRKWILAVAGAAALAGCASDPYYYNDRYYDGYAYRDGSVYRDYPYTYYGYGPGYYVSPPSVSFGLAYNDGYWRRHPWHG